MSEGDYNYTDLSKNVFRFAVDESCKGIRLDVWLSEKEEICLSRSFAQKLIDDGCVSVNERAVSKSYKLSIGDEIAVNLPEPVDTEIVPENIPLDIVYEDTDLLIVNKPKGMVVHPSSGCYTGTLVNALMYHCGSELSGINGVIRPGIVHRIDKNTSGLLIVAKSDVAHIGLAEQIKEHSFTREYEGICVGRFKESSGTIDAPIGRDKADRKRMCVTPYNSKSAVTHYSLIRELRSRNSSLYSHMSFKLETGRTHQIRVHCAYVGHPILGDDVYGKPYKNCEGQCLHAKKMGFVHPISGEYIEFSVDPPEYFLKLITDMTVLE